jgi:hypothetical protein
MEGIRPDRRRFGYPDRVASRCVGDGAIMRGDEAGGVVARIDPQALARLVEVGVDGVFGNAQAPGDLLGTQMLINQTQAFPLSRGQNIQGPIALFCGLLHKVQISFISTRLSTLCFESEIALAVLHHFASSLPKQAYLMLR